MEDNNIIQFGDKTFTSSPYQKSIFNEIEHGSGNMVVTAAAGSAKTTTIENCLRFIPSDKRKLFLAFNVSTVEKLKSEIKNTNGTRIMTFHGLGNRILRENGIITEETMIDEFKYSRHIKTNINTLTAYGESESLGIERISYIANITSLVNYCRYYMAMRVREIKDVAEIYGIVPVRDEYDVVRNVLIWGKENISSIDHTDMIWLPNILNLATKKYLFDFIFIDEAQDTTLAHQDMVDKCFKRGCRFVAVGDPKQQINVWCGATEKAIERYESRPNTKKMKLPVSYRCPKKVVEVAKEFSEDIVAADWAIDGEINVDVSANLAKPGDMVLCRIISKLIEQYMTYLRNNKKAYLKGSDAVRSTYLDLIGGINAKRIDARCLTTNGLIPQLYKLYFDRLESIKERMNIDEEEAMYHYEALNLFDNIEAIKVLSEGLDTVDELIDKINTIFNGDENDAIILSTVHKAKGMEADNIFILCPSLMPSRLATKEWEIQAERNLMYVAVTRAKKTLNMIKEEQKGFYRNFSSSIDMEATLSAIREKINYVSSVRSEISAAINNQLPAKNADNKPQETEKKKKKGLKFLDFS
ncbi:MAG: ATP-dependent helicase [Bacteroidales bacterium]|nr:ATP-dependent helicase [Bacteroidales bacterium]